MPYQTLFSFFSSPSSLLLFPSPPSLFLLLFLFPFPFLPLLQAITYMESLLYSRPPLSLQPGVFGNLSAAYDLESGASQTKKQAFLPLLGQMVGEGFHLPSLNIR